MKFEKTIRKATSYILSMITAAGLLFSGSGFGLPSAGSAGILNVNAHSSQIAENVNVYINQNPGEIVKMLNFEYKNNSYLSLRDLAMNLSNTSKSFSVTFTRKDDDLCTVIKTHDMYEPVGTENTPFDEETLKDDSIVNYKRSKLCLTIDDNDYYFYMIPYKDSEGNQDIFVNSGEFALSMNIDMAFMNEDLYIYPGNEFDFTSQNVINSDFFYMADSCLVGDATTGEVYFSLNGDEAVSIASTTKLMTYLLLSEAIRKGDISESDSVTFSREAQRISNSGDGVIPVTEGQTAPLHEAVKGMLIASSNECALAIAEKVSGSEAEFVKKMNEKAAAIGLSDSTCFYNSNGLPIFMDDILPSKLQNRMSANDMFILVSYIMNNYPEITEITSLKKVKLDSLGKEIKSTNTLLYNIPGVVGLKTGTTYKAKSCLVSAYKTQDLHDNDHYITAIVFGAENARLQNYTSLVLMKYGIQSFNAGVLGITPQKEEEDDTVPETLEGLVEKVINTARKHV